MRLPTRNGRVVSAISEIRRLVPQPVPQPDELRENALKLYRTIIRTIYRAPPSQVRTETYQHARREFERNRSVTDPFSVENHLKSGWLEYKMLAHYFEEQRHFSKPLVRRNFPHKRVEMLQSLLKVTPTHKRARVRHMLRNAERRVERVADLERVLADADAAWTRGNRLEFEWLGILNGMKERIQAEQARQAG